LFSRSRWGLALGPAASAGDSFVAPLSGGEEVPARDAPASGVAKFKLREDGTALLFKVNVSDIENVVAAHIHCAAVGVNGPVGVTLFLAPPAVPWRGRWLRERSPPRTPATPAGGSIWRRSWQRWKAGPHGLVAYLLTPAPTGEAVVGW
jgi:hypothetical protein